MACQATPRADEQTESMIETITDLVAVIDAIREAANSIAKGIPSSRRQTSSTATASSANGSPRPDSGRVRRTTPPPRRIQRRHRPQLLVGDADSFATGGQDFHGRRRREDRLDQIGGGCRRTCSQLSKTNSRSLPSNAAATDSLTLIPGCWVFPSAAATASDTDAGSVTAASSKNQTPSGNHRPAAPRLRLPAASCRPRPPRST